MPEENKHWTSKVKVFECVNIKDVEKTLNDFAENRFVIATQLFQVIKEAEAYYDIIVYFKVPPKA